MQSRPSRRGSRRPRKGSMGGHSATITSIPAGASALDERGNLIRRRKTGRSRRFPAQVIEANRQRGLRLSDAQREIWALLDPDTPMTPTELAKTVGRTVGSTTSSLYALARKELATRQAPEPGKHSRGWLRTGQLPPAEAA